MLKIEEEMRSELEIFKELENLCISVGYSHIIAYLCFRDNNIDYDNKISTEDLLRMLSPKRLVRTEISTLIGLMCKQKIDFSMPEPEDFKRLLEKTEYLLHEVHLSMMQTSGVMENIFKGLNPFKSGLVLREPIFYGGESAYHFQYRDFSSIKYCKDNAWFIQNKGY
jgi:hypothetical protein